MKQVIGGIWNNLYKQMPSTNQDLFLYDFNPLMDSWHKIYPLGLQNIPTNDIFYFLTKN